MEKKVGQCKHFALGLRVGYEVYCYPMGRGKWLRRTGGKEVKTSLCSACICLLMTAPYQRHYPKYFHYENKYKLAFPMQDLRFS
jgi:hypothetical protein